MQAGGAINSSGDIHAAGSSLWGPEARQVRVGSAHAGCQGRGAPAQATLNISISISITNTNSAIVACVPSPHTPARALPTVQAGGATAGGSGDGVGFPFCASNVASVVPSLPALQHHHGAAQVRIQDECLHSRRGRVAALVQTFLLAMPLAVCTGSANGSAHSGQQKPPGAQHSRLVA